MLTTGMSAWKVYLRSKVAQGVGTQMFFQLKRGRCGGESPVCLGYHLQILKDSATLVAYQQAIERTKPFPAVNDKKIVVLGREESCFPFSNTPQGDSEQFSGYSKPPSCSSRGVFCTVRMAGTSRFGPFLPF